MLGTLPEGCSEMWTTENSYLRLGALEGDEGICHGAATVWCYSAMGGTYDWKPATMELGRAQQLAMEFVNYGENHIYDASVSSLKGLWTGGILGVEPVNTIGNFRADDVIQHVVTHPGVYLVRGGTHYFGVSSRDDNYYVYDNENGLYHCTRRASLKELVKKLRNQENDWDDNMKEGRNLNDVRENHMYRWYCFQCTSRRWEVEKIKIQIGGRTYTDFRCKKIFRG